MPISQKRDFRGHFPLGTVTDPDQDTLPLVKLADLAAPQGLHMHENIGCAGAAGNESITLRPIEPFHHAFEGRSGRVSGVAGGMVSRGRHRSRGRVINRYQLDRLPAAGTHHRFANDRGAFLNRPEAGLPHTDLMQKNIVLLLGGGNEAITLYEIEPFYLPNHPCRVGLRCRAGGHRYLANRSLLMMLHFPVLRDFRIQPANAVPDRRFTNRVGGDGLSVCFRSGKGRSKYGTGGQVRTPIQVRRNGVKARTMSELEPENGAGMAPFEAREEHGRGGSAGSGRKLEPATRQLARQVLGLDAIDNLPDALAPRPEQLWRLDHFAAKVPFTNPMFVPMGTSADIGVLYKALAIVVGRHDALRTRLAVRHGRAIQIVEDWKEYALDVVRIRKEDLTDDRPGRKTPVSEFTQRSIDLYAQEGFQCQAFRDEDGQVTLGFLAHGFLSDAWSSQLLFHEIRAAYSALSDRRALALEPVAAQYRDFARCQRRSLDRDMDSHLAYWHEKLKDMPSARLPGAHSGTTGRRGRSYFFVDNEIVARLAALARINRVSLTLVLMAGYQLALARWSGQRKILSAAYTADRINPRFRNTFGFLVTNMPVCARITPHIAFTTFLNGFAKEFYDGYANRELSCELYEAIFSPEKPFCATVFNFVPLQRNFFDSELHSIPSFKETIVAPDASRPAIYREIYLGLAQYPNGILGKLFYNADRFTPDSAEDLIRNFKYLLSAITHNPEEHLSELV